MSVTAREVIGLVHDYINELQDDPGLAYQTSEEIIRLAQRMRDHASAEYERRG